MSLTNSFVFYRFLWESLNTSLEFITHIFMLSVTFAHIYVRDIYERISELGFEHCNITKGQNLPHRHIDMKRLFKTLDFRI